jgi:hypothetical protein
MGNEVNCVARIAGKRQAGKALLETNELVFRGAQCRVKIRFAEMRSVTAAAGELCIESPAGTTVLEVGELAQKWRQKILHPKTRIEKLGVQAGTRVALVGDAEPVFLRELRESRAEISTGGAGRDSELTFLFVENQSGLGKVSKIAPRIKGAAGLWIIYPKGKKEISEGEVIRAGRTAGFKDIKVVGFSPSHTALKFVIPVDRR